MLPVTDLLEPKGKGRGDVNRGVKLAGKDLKYQNEDPRRAVATISVSLRRPGSVEAGSLWRQSGRCVKGTKQ